MSKSCRIIVESLEHETRLNRIHEYKRFQQMLTRFGYWRRRKLIIPITTDESRGSIPLLVTNFKPLITMINKIKSISVENVITFAVLTFVLVSWSAVVIHIIATGGSTIQF